MPKNKRRQDGAVRTRGNAHDYFFRSLVSSPDKVRAIFRLAFSAVQLEHFDLDTVAIEPGNWVDADELHEQRADLVVSVHLKSGENLLVFVLAEHKSRPDRGLMVQLLKYQSSLYVQRKANAVLPVVVYHGKQPDWPGERTFLASRRLPEGFAEIDPEVGLGFQLMADIWETGVQTYPRLMKRSLVLPAGVRLSFLKRALLYLLMVNPSQLNQ